MDKIPKEVLEVNNDNWKPCILCGGRLTQIRRSLFGCLECGMEFIVDGGI